MSFHDFRENFIIEIFQEAIKSPIRRKRTRNIKATKMSNQKIIVKIIDKVGNHGETFTFHDNKGTNHSVI